MDLVFLLSVVAKNSRVRIYFILSVENNARLEFMTWFIKTETCASVIPTLLKLINDPLARTEENEIATENAISAVAKILKYNSSHINVDDVLPHW